MQLGETDWGAVASGVASIFSSNQQYKAAAANQKAQQANQQIAQQQTYLQKQQTEMIVKAAIIGTGIITVGILGYLALRNQKE